MLTPEISLGIGTIAILLLSGAILLRDAPRTESGLLPGLLCFSVAAYAAQTMPLAFPPSWLGPLQVISTGTPALLWIWTGRVFDDAFQPSWRDVVAWVIAPLVRGIGFFHWFPALGWTLDGLSLLFTALTVWRVLAGLRDDLIERRRRLRPVFSMLAALYSGWIIVGRLVSPATANSTDARLADAVILAALSVTFLLLSLRGRQSFTAPRPAVARAAAPPSPPAIDDQEAGLLARLDRLMGADKVYRREGFTIASLAGQLDLPEYRLRRLINQRLGHKNFASFVNGHRLAEAMAALADPGQAEVPILTIALDAGFQSIGPFNRAFKAQTGLTPSAYRRQAESQKS